LRTRATRGNSSTPILAFGALVSVRTYRFEYDPPVAELSLPECGVASLRDYVGLATAKLK
jgi:hypothetical protein